MSLYWADVLRLAIVISGIFYGFSMFPVMVLHYKAWRAIRLEDRLAGLLPLHVAVISAGNMILTYGLVSGVIATMGNDFTWRLPLYLFGFVLGIAALVIVGTRQRRRIKFQRGSMTVRVEENASLIQKD